MILIYHHKNKVTRISKSDAIVSTYTVSIAGSLLALAKDFPDEILVWCHSSLEEQLNVSAIEKLFHHKKLMLSYNPSEISYLDKSIGYVDSSPFVRVNYEVFFATWQMSSWVGVVHASVLNAIKNEVVFDNNFDYFLISLAKLGMQKGLLCSSEPSLLKNIPEIPSIKASRFTLFRFVKQHYKTRWIFLLSFNLIVFERKFPVLPFLLSFFYKNRTKTNLDLDAIEVQSSRIVIDKATIDVIIPTIGRRNYLYDVLQDFSKQTVLPNKIIIVEQNPIEGSESELDYLTNENWPFEIQHTFIHQAGACNARNIALQQTTSEWVFLADDDIRIANNFIQKTLEAINKYGVKAATLKCYQNGENNKEKTVFQWFTFGSGCSFVFGESLKSCKFNMGYEFGYGEDGDFGMQLRHKGCDVLYLPEPEILHLKAPVGGFRTKPVLQWQNDSIQPKPSPTIMLYQILHNTDAQTNSYKTTLFFKFYRLQTIKNPLKYYINFQKQWRSSVFWANELRKQNE